MLPETRGFIEGVERETNQSVIIAASETKYLGKTLLSDYLSNDGNEITISYNPSYNSADYAVAHEAARLLRYRKDTTPGLDQDEKAF